jgi:tetratricopeptide (TPR) repeat protein
MAFLTSRWFADQNGFSEYTKRLKRDFQGIRMPVDIKTLREFRYSNFLGRLKNLGQDYPEHFYTDVTRLGLSLAYVAEGEDICRIISAASLEEWIKSLPQDRQYIACQVLEFPADGLPIPDQDFLLDKLFYALYRKGDHEGALREFTKISTMQPKNAAAYYYLGRVHLNLRHYQAALDAFKNAETFNCLDKNLPGFTGHAYRGSEDFTSAAECYQKAVQNAPRSASTAYWLADALRKSGDLESARAAWEKVLTLDDKHYAKLAQKALQENPLPADAAQE